VAGVVRTVRTRKRPQSVGPNKGAGPLAAGLGSVWLASGDRTITRIDAQTGRVVTRIGGVDTAPSLGGIAVGADSVWVAGALQESMLTRIDPRRNAVSARIFFEQFRLNGIALGGGGVWVSDVGNDQVWLIDPARNMPVGATKVGPQPLGVGSGAGSIWVANSGDGTVSRIDPASRRVVETITVGGSPNEIVATDDGIWSLWPSRQSTPGRARAVRGPSPRRSGAPAQRRGTPVARQFDPVWTTSGA
jgi:YVTN family beta-propeller protein